MTAAKLWTPKHRRHKHHRRRARRECFGELVQTDGSIHDWLEGRGPHMTLLVMIDDATSKVVARFYPAETTEGYFDLLRRYIRKRGIMVTIYADRHSIFFTTDANGEAVLTQFGRALRDLGIELIPAASPQAKGRVEPAGRQALQRHRPGPAGQGTSPGWRHDHRRGQYRPGRGLPSLVQPALHGQAHQRQ